MPYDIRSKLWITLCIIQNQTSILYLLQDSVQDSSIPYKYEVEMLCFDS